MRIQRQCLTNIFDTNQRDEARLQCWTFVFTQRPKQFKLFNSQYSKDNIVEEILIKWKCCFITLLDNIVEQILIKWNSAFIWSEFLQQCYPLNIEIWKVWMFVSLSKKMLSFGVWLHLFDLCRKLLSNTVLPGANVIKLFLSVIYEFS